MTLIGHSNIRKNDTVYDLGAGSGVITHALARRCKEVVAVEIEPNALEKLRQNTEGLANVKIITQNILDLQPQEEKYKIFANIPFSLSSDIIRHFLYCSHTPAAMYFIVQKQFARKLVPSPAHFTSQLGIMLGAYYEVRIRLPLRKTDFTPPPAVDTVLLELKRREAPLVPHADLARYDTYTRQCFENKAFFQAQPRTDVGISPEKKPSELSIEQWCALFTAAQ